MAGTLAVQQLWPNSRSVFAEGSQQGSQDSALVVCATKALVAVELTTVGFGLDGACGVREVGFVDAFVLLDAGLVVDVLLVVELNLVVVCLVVDVARKVDTSIVW